MSYVLKEDEFGGWDAYVQIPTGIRYIDTYETLEEAQSEFPDAEVIFYAP